MSKYNLDKVHADLRKMGFINDVSVPRTTDDIERLVRNYITELGVQCGLPNCDIRLGEINDDAWFDLRKSIHNVLVEWLVTIAVPALARRNDLRLAIYATEQHDMEQHRCIRGANFVSCSCGFHATREHDRFGMGYLFRIDYETKASAHIYSPYDVNIMCDVIGGVAKQIGHCDKCGRENNPVRIIAYTDVGKDLNDNVHICQQCFAVEMNWRISRNDDLGHDAFHVFGWDDPDPANVQDTFQLYSEYPSVDEQEKTSR
jgi:hypothetical protein